MTTPATPFVCSCCSRQSAGARRAWCRLELLELRSLWTNGVATADIAARLGRSVRSVELAARGNGFVRAVRGPRRLRCPCCGGLFQGSDAACADCQAQIRETRAGVAEDAA